VSFTLEFEPLGIRLLCEEPLTLLDAVRQASIHLRSECGGKGNCAKCQLQVIKGSLPPITELESRTFTPVQIQQGYRLACRTLAENDLVIFLPAQSLISNQVLQTEGVHAEIEPDPAVQLTALTLTPPTFNDLKADWERVQSAIAPQGIPQLSASLPALVSLADQLRQSNWQVNLIHNKKELLHVLPPGDLHSIGLAVDVGSTKLACFLVDLTSGQTLAARGISNPQIAFGEDIMSRLAAVLENPANAATLQQDVIQSIQAAVEEMAEKLDLPIGHVMDACLVGNTAMHHFFLGLPSQALAVSPFVPVTTADLYPPASEIGLKLMPGAKLYAPPVIAGFVGSDHLAFLLAAGFDEDKRTRLGIDIGTNTEIALQHAGRIVSVSTASGPAFEGAHIRFGMRAAPGAIEHVTIDDEGSVHCQVIGGQKASGICGSGILDGVAELRRTGLMNSRSRLDKTAPALQPNQFGNPALVLIPEQGRQREISLDQKDIDQILLAKGAIRAGIEILMDHLKINAAQLDEIVIAGAFGSYLNPEQAVRIGLLPDIPLDRMHAIGNASGVGARMLLISQKMRAKAKELAQRIEYLELTIYPDFNLFFANGIKS
jgi:uncharacterized 2Fe-2S/4Fe-4S cluster protein (DUF4445 family)